ncbi:hypothetical protein UFOVP1604_159 [uncultured Caudovirales phage]|uniref:Uncharacterized protein n=1 Tax=uncultured Caudovirales phage TaxID=2100421 RepID=A0A6J5SVQ1_9CAUD|nr:hypothetical protein UFOVP1604_159 [uncultured Caudovirales phage]
MKSLVKGFSQFINEELELSDSDRIEIDLIEELPDLFSRAARIGNEDSDDEYTHDITTTLTAIKCDTPDDIDQLRNLGLAQGAWETDPDWIEALDQTLYITDKFIDDSFHTGQVKIKIVFKDQENEYGGYSASGGGIDRTVFCGVQEFTKDRVLDKFTDLLRYTNIFEY